MSELPPPLEQDPRGDVWANWLGAVLLDDEIRFYCKRVDPALTAPFKEEDLKPARYVLTLGREARVGGEVKNIDAATPLRIPAHQVAIVRTDEVLVLPRFMIGRWNLAVGEVYKGLLWTGALQVDPGWRGYLPCPLYNLSDKEIELPYQERLFTIDFVRTTRWVKGINQAYPTPGPDRPERYNLPIAKWDEHRLHSGPYEALANIKLLSEKVEIELPRQMTELRSEVQKEISEARQLAVNGITFLLAILGVLVAAIALLPSINAGAPFLKGKDAIVAVLALLALALSGGVIWYVWATIKKR